MIDLSRLEAIEVMMLFAAVAWSLLAAGGLAFFVSHRDASLKRRLWPWANVFVAGSFVVLALWASGPSLEVAPLLLVGVGGLSVFAYRAAQFCGRCGSTVFSANPFVRERFCPRCAARLHSDSG